ncbi:DUF2796 domain-containing protein [Photobacterium sp. CAU 1568]|uniref:DUF2796 domain-containing protein n=1 Tax=Photobacterium arenosum TaxID=2774143 RepID=A0ABR9BJ74_9GAMM|nr:DUF2796 domain-containing protein [Photobacterium arenosum]MBD8512598.1 DUF2796 domain-containing protein [Photobacterium arenosum]
MHTHKLRAASWLLASTAVCSLPSWANTQHDAHVHGQVELNIAQDGNDLLLEITAPASDVLGFEHAPHTEAEQQALSTALQQLKQPASLFVLPAEARCSLQDSHITHTLPSHSDDEHEGHDEHEHEHEHEHEDHHGHAEFSVQSVYRCEQIQELGQLTLNWFSHFPATENIQVQAISDKGQKATTLNAAQPVFRF